MKVGALIVCPGLGDPGFLRAVGEAAEAAGLDSLWLADHVVFPRAYRTPYPYSPDGKLNTPPYPEPLATLAFLAAVTSRIELATGVLVLPQRSPVLVAKQAATVHQLSGGRLRLGIGAGWLREEFEVLGADFDSRGARMNESIDVMRALWREDAPVFHGQFTSLDGSIAIEPRPPGDAVPIIVGGHTRTAALRAGRRGDGFFPLSYDVGVLAELYAIARDARSGTAGALGDLELLAMSPAVLDRARALADIGTQHLVVPVAVSGSDIEALLERLRPLEAFHAEVAGL
jgi:probable F420-dependent oxidoreductase